MTMRFMTEWPHEHETRAAACRTMRPARRRIGAGGAIQYAILGLISACESGGHGYQLKLDFDARYGDFWSLNFGQLYRTLDRLEGTGLIEGTEQAQTNRPTRKVYRITASGRRAIDDWLLVPPNDEPHAPRDDLSVRLLCLSDRQTEAGAIIQNQRAMDLKYLARLARRRSLLEKSGNATLVERLLLLQADMRLQADMAWLDLVEQALAKCEDVDAAASFREGPPASPSLQSCSTPARGRTSRCPPSGRSPG
jgi:DNA-binding PadR family transcriptional regulator